MRRLKLFTVVGLFTVMVGSLPLGFVPSVSAQSSVPLPLTLYCQQLFGSSAQALHNNLTNAQCLIDQKAPEQLALILEGAGIVVGGVGSGISIKHNKAGAITGIASAALSFLGLLAEKVPYGHRTVSVNLYKVCQLYYPGSKPGYLYDSQVFSLYKSGQISRSQAERMLQPACVW